MLKFGLCLLAFLSVMYSSKCDTIPNNQHKIFTEAMEKMDSSFKHYSKDLDNTITWKELRSQLSSLNLRYDFHSPDATNFLKAIREEVSSGTQKYLESSSIMYGWATFASSSLGIYLEIIDSDHYNGTDMILDVLDRSIRKMDETIPLLLGVHEDFSDASNNFALLAQEFNVTKLDGEDGFLKNELNAKIRVAGGAQYSQIIGSVVRELAPIVCPTCATATAVVGSLVRELARVFCPKCADKLMAVIGERVAVIATAAGEVGAEAIKAEIESVIIEIGEYYDSLSKAMKDVSEKIDKTIQEISSEISSLRTLKAKAESEHYLEMNAVVVAAIKISANKLINTCNAYIEFHK